MKTIENLNALMNTANTRFNVGQGWSLSVRDDYVVLSNEWIGELYFNPSFKLNNDGKLTTLVLFSYHISNAQTKEEEEMLEEMISLSREFE